MCADVILLNDVFLAWLKIKTTHTCVWNTGYLNFKCLTIKKVGTELSNLYFFYKMSGCFVGEIYDVHNLPMSRLFTCWSWSLVSDWLRKMPGIYDMVCVIRAMKKAAFVICITTLVTAFLYGSSIKRHEEPKGRPTCMKRWFNACFF